MSVHKRNFKRKYKGANHSKVFIEGYVNYTPCEGLFQRIKNTHHKKLCKDCALTDILIDI